MLLSRGWPRHMLVSVENAAVALTFCCCDCWWMQCFGPGSKRRSCLLLYRLPRCLRHHQPPLPGLVLDSCRSTVQDRGRIVKAIYAEATEMVRLRLPSGETLWSEPFPVRRGVIQGDIFSPRCFTLGLDRIFRLHDIAGQGIGGPSLCDVTASKLEYADDIGLLD